VAVSILTALMPRMSAAAELQGEYDAPLVTNQA